jgi:hypothetical protein
MKRHSKLDLESLGYCNTCGILNQVQDDVSLRNKPIKQVDGLILKRLAAAATTA